MTTPVIRPQPWKQQVQRLFGVLVFVLLLGLGYGLSLALEGRLVVTGYRIRDLQQQRAALQRSIADLSAQLATVTSYEVMAERAAALGYHPARPGEMLYLPAGDVSLVSSVPLQPSHSTSQPVIDPDLFPATYRESWLERLSRWWAEVRR